MHMHMHMHERARSLAQPYWVHACRYPPWVRVVYGGRRELAAATELDRWVTKVLPELFLPPECHLNAT